MAPKVHNLVILNPTIVVLERNVSFIMVNCSRSSFIEFTGFTDNRLESSTEHNEAIWGALDQRSRRAPRQYPDSSGEANDPD